MKFQSPRQMFPACPFLCPDNDDGDGDDGSFHLLSFKHFSGIH